VLPQLADRHAKGQHPKYIRGISWAVDRVFNSKADIRYPFPKMPELDILPLEVTPTTTLGPIIAEEGSIDGNYEVLKDIYLSSSAFP
jgi:hypothetical protein